MKNLILSAIVFCSATSAFAAARPAMSAFATDSKIYVTVLTDGCNSSDAELKIDPTCADDRKTKNWASTCKAELVVTPSAQNECGKDAVQKPGTLEFDIKEANIAAEAEVLQIKNGGETIKVQLKN